MCLTQHVDSVSHLLGRLTLGTLAAFKQLILGGAHLPTMSNQNCNKYKIKNRHSNGLLSKGILLSPRQKNAFCQNDAEEGIEKCNLLKLDWIYCLETI